MTSKGKGKAAAAAHAALQLAYDAMVEKYDLLRRPKRGRPHFNGTYVAEFFERELGLCVIDDEPHWIPHIEDDPRRNNIYVSGRAQLGKTLKRLAPNLSKKDYDDVWQDLVDHLADAEERGLIFQSRRDTFVDAAGQIIRINTPIAGEVPVVEVVGEVSADDHVTAARRINAVYDPGIDHDEFVEGWLLEIAQGDPWLAWLMVQASFSSCLCPSSEHKGLVCLYGPHGSDSKGVLSHVRYSLFSPGAFFKGRLHRLKGFQAAMLLGKIGFVDDDLQDGALGANVSSDLKGWTGGDAEDVEPKYGTKPVTVSDPTFIVATNHPLQLAQVEQATKAWKRRLTVVPCYQVYADDPDPRRGELPRVKGFYHMITDDPKRMSFLLNLALEGVRMLIEDEYVQTPESRRLKREWLGLGNSVADFFDEVDVFGREWSCPHLVRLGPSGRERALVYPSWMTRQAREHLHRLEYGSPSQSGCYYYDEPRERYETRLAGSRADHANVQVLVAHDIATILGRYSTWHSDNGGDGRGRLQRNNFSRLLKPAGYVTKQKRTPLLSGKKITAVYEKGYGYEEWLEHELASHNEVGARRELAGDKAPRALPYPNLLSEIDGYVLDMQLSSISGVAGPPMQLLDGTEHARISDVSMLDERCRNQLALFGLMVLANRACLQATSTGERDRS